MPTQSEEERCHMEVLLLYPVLLLLSYIISIWVGWIWLIRNVRFIPVHASQKRYDICIYFGFY